MDTPERPGIGLPSSEQEGTSAASIPPTENIRDLIAEVVAKTIQAERQKEQAERESFMEEEEEEEDMLTSGDEDEVTEEINDQIAKFIDTKLSQSYPREKLKTKLQGVKRPKNLKYCKEAKINNHLYKNISLIAKKRDGGLRRLQGMITKGISQLSKVADVILAKGKQKETERSLTDIEINKVHKEIFDGLTIMCQVSHQLNMKRVSKTE